MAVSRSKDCKAAVTAERGADQVEKDYSPEFAQIAMVMRGLGANDEDLAKAFGVDSGTIRSWQTTHNDFAEACRESADAQVERALYQCAVGYEYIERKLVRSGKEFVNVELLKHEPPDVKACIFWLSKRRPSRWGPKSSNADAVSPLQQLAKELVGTALKPKDDPPRMQPPPRPGITDATTEDDEPESPPNGTDDNKA